MPVRGEALFRNGQAQVLSVWFIHCVFQWCCVQALKGQPEPRQAVIPTLTELASCVGRQEVNTEASKICVKVECSGEK